MNAFQVHDRSHRTGRLRQLLVSIRDNRWEAMQTIADKPVISRGLQSVEHNLNIIILFVLLLRENTLL